MSGLIPFQFKDKTVRVITDGGHTVWFVAKEVAEALGYSNPSESVQYHCKKSKSLKSLDNSKTLLSLNINGLRSDTQVIPESDVYRLVMRSKLESSEAFQDWVVEDVLPSIRKTGGYSTAQNLPDFTNPILAARAWADEMEAKQAALTQIEADKPKIEFAMAVRNVEGTVSVCNFAQALGTGQNKFFRWLRENGYLKENNQPYQKYLDLQWLVSAEGSPYMDSKGRSHPTFTTRITGKGQVALEKRFRKGPEKVAA